MLAYLEVLKVATDGAVDRNFTGWSLQDPRQAGYSFIKGSGPDDDDHDVQRRLVLLNR